MGRDREARLARLDFRPRGNDGGLKEKDAAVFIPRFRCKRNTRATILQRRHRCVII